MHPAEKNPRFTNPLIDSASPYLKQHAHNPVFWYPWGAEALARAKAENKPILISIGYSTCYWCHVMERDVFENVSIASLMNQHFINIKIDREEHPHLDEIYMVARQLLTREGGWPNNVFLTPDLKPFFAGGTYSAVEAYGKPAFPRLLEWLNYAWTTKPDEVKKTADQLTQDMQTHLIFSPQTNAQPVSAGDRAAQLFKELRAHHDERSGGFFQAPKFPHECYLSFLLKYYESTGNQEALDMVARSIGKMASGGIYDQVGCGFYRYAVDKEWYVPHFEKMLYTQAQMARVCLDAARITSNSYFADIAKGVLDFVSGPLTDKDGAFYAAIDAESEGVEGQYYAWESTEIENLLTPAETAFFVKFFALADIPTFPGHKHPDGQVIIARAPLFQAALEHKMPYVAVAAMTGEVMNKLLTARNRRVPPALDNKIIVSWNGLMIDAFAQAGMVFGNDKYTNIAQRAADYLLIHALDANGFLSHTVNSGKPDIPGMLEDYAYFIKGLITLLHASPSKDLLKKTQEFARQADELFWDAESAGYYSTPPQWHALVRIKNADDSAMPNANAVMLGNLAQLYGVTQDTAYLEKAKKMSAFFLQGSNRNLSELATMIHSGLIADQMDKAGPVATPAVFTAMDTPAAPDDAVSIRTTLSPKNAGPGDSCELAVALDIKDGWHINSAKPKQPYLIPTQLDVQGEGVELLEVIYPEPLQKIDAISKEVLLSYHGNITVTARLKLVQGGKKRPKIKALLRFQPCTGTTCHEVRDISLTV